MTLIGTDPEVFLHRGGKHFVGYDGNIQGTKELPQKDGDWHYQLDGCAIEYNTPPTDDVNYFIKSVTEGWRRIANVYGDPSVDISRESSVEFKKTYLKKLPKPLQELGCNPDYNAYSCEMNLPPNPLLNLRTAAGHVHIGWTHDALPRDQNHFKTCVNVVGYLDIHLGLPSLFLDAQGAIRRQLYGKAGCFRPTSYGVEYRTLSNFWIFEEKLCEWVFHRARQSVLFPGLPDVWVKKAIDENNKELAQALMEEYGVEHP